MIEKTSGIVLHSFKYGETSVIARVFTREKGVQSYLIPGVRKAKSKIRANLFQPLTMLSMVVYYKERGGLQRIKEVSCPKPFSNIPYDIRKSSVAMFLAEMISQALKEQDVNHDMYDFMEDSLIFFDQAPSPPADFHLHFLISLSRYLGFQPAKNHTDGLCYFNMKEGLFQPAFPGHELGMDRELSHYLHVLNTTTAADDSRICPPKSVRRAMLNSTIKYYRLHLDGIKEISSHAVLEEIMR